MRRSNGLSTHLLSAPLDFVIHYLSILTQPSYSLKAVVASTLGCSIVLTLVHQCAVLLSDEVNVVTILNDMLLERLNTFIILEPES